MSSKSISIVFVFFLVSGGLICFLNFEGDIVQGGFVSGPITVDTTWDLAGSPYIVVGDVIVEVGVTLTIEPGVEVKFDGYYSLHVEGNLSAIGNEKMRINITSNQLVPTHDDWFSIVTNSTGHVDIRYCDISYGHYGVYLEFSSNNIIMNNTIFSNNFSGVFLISSSNNNSVIGNTIFSNDDHGIFLNSSNSNIITNNNITDNDQGISLRYSSNNTVENNTCDSNRDQGIRLDYSSGNKVWYNTVSSHRFGITLQTSSKNNITGNNVSVHEQGIKLSDSSHNNSIIDNNVSSSYFSIIIGSSSSFNRITNNFISNCDNGISLSRSYSNNLTLNTMIKNGIFISGDLLEHWNTHRIDTSNTVNGKPVYCWKNQTEGSIPSGAGQVILANSTNVNIENQELIDSQCGIALGFSSNNNIISNDLSLNKYYGIYLFNSADNYIIGNNVSNNNRSISFRDSWNNNVISNMLSNNVEGVYLKTSSNNTFHYNQLLNNTRQIYLHNTTCFNNSWDDGIGEGNYWSDYNGVDDGSGGRTAGDGVGDTEIPHPLTDQGEGYYQLDNFPLMNPISNFTFLYEGWNLISIPFIQPDTNLDAVLRPITGSYDAVQWYNVSDTSDLWKHNHNSKPSHLNDLHHINHSMGFWIHIIEPGGVLFEYIGTSPTQNQSIALHVGWNHVGYPSRRKLGRTTALNNIIYGSDVDMIQTYDASTKTWMEIGPSDNFEIGRGYWVHSRVEKTWEVPL